MGEKRKIYVVLLLVFSLVALSGNLMAKEKKGAKLKVEKNDYQQVTGELITVKKGSLLLLDLETEADFLVDIKDVKAITIMKKSFGFQVGVIGVLAGFVYGSTISTTFKEWANA